ncbi:MULTISPECIES: N-acetyltransferase [Acinetobacter]|uniref:N-acetyltransferase domain-containing protein n=1 Tax=Acinetobacter courvalinii TaxID=280147 RepID=N9PTM9_9GAMM|nr:N-acetyltransferase [Acinetobacter courvalinii]ENX36904.1 hypothetical protein F888_02240 [Acinetobacter courvalinii]KAB0658289.1 N-acetyltransferase [Acinetobacter courvalinii]GGH30601.1 hypothetical protein GCM10007354_10740 [Acinetobacter courvalinii]
MNNNIVNDDTERNAISETLESFLVDRLKYSKKKTHFTIRELDGKTKCFTSFFAGRSSIGKPNEFYIRFGEHGYKKANSKYIIVARLSFHHRNKGHGTAFLKYLCLFGEKFGYEFLEIECPNSDCRAFMKKIGFKDQLYLPILELKQSIQTYEAQKST